MNVRKRDRAHALKLLIVLVAGLVLAGGGAFAQVVTGSIVGNVLDGTGALVVGAEITLTNLGTAERRTASSDAAGFYRFLNLLPGDYRIEARQAGFKAFRREPVRVTVDASVRIDISLEIGNVAETIEVTAETPLLQAQTSSLGQVVEDRTVQQMPLNGRNVLNLVALVPGVVPQGGAMGTPTGKNIFSWGNYQIGGGESNQSATTLDGAPVNVPYVNLTALIPTQDSIREFKVQTNNLGAEFGRFSGGVINLATRSGTNSFHGTAYEFLRNKVLNANTFFNNANRVERPPFTQNQYGVNTGGPIKKDKLFFFGSFEGYRLRVGRSFLYSVPTPAMRQGDLSEHSRQIYDPFSVSTAEDFPRQPFPGNKIPASMLDPVALQMQEYYALPNQPGVINNYATNASAGGNQEQVNARFDYNVSEKQRIFGRWTIWKNSSIGMDPFGTKTHIDAGPEDNTTNHFVFNDTYLFSPNVIADFRVAYLRFRYDRIPASAGFDLSSIGWPASLNNEVVFRHVPYPRIAGEGYNNVFGANGTGSFIRARNENYSLLPNLTWIKGGHTLKFGGDFRRMIHNYAQSNNPSGVVDFNQSFTSSERISPQGGIGYASFLLGTGSGGNISSPALVAGQLMYRAYYFNDTWQVTSRLNINLGLRLEQQGPWSERYDRLTVFLPEADHPFAAETGLPLKGRLALVNSDLRPSRNSQDLSNNWSPRIGLAYRVLSKTVLRGGYGLFWVPRDVIWDINPNNDAINSVGTPWVTTLDGGITPYRLLRDAFPEGVLRPGIRSEENILNFTGLGVSAPIPHGRNGNYQQWNFNIQQELPSALLVDIAYAGSKGTHLPRPNHQINQLPDELLSLGPALLDNVPNPFFGLIRTGGIAGPTVQRGQLLRPFPQYTGVGSKYHTHRNSNYHALQLKVQKQLRGGGSILASYSAGKTITDSNTQTGWLEESSSGKYGSNNNLRAWRSLANFDVSQRLVVSYVMDLPIGKGQRFGNNVQGVAGKLISGWGVDGVSTFQTGFPVFVNSSLNLSNSFGGSQFPVNNGQSAELSGPAQERLGRWFDTSVFSQAPAFTFGNTSPVLPDVRGHGANNWDMSVFKNTQLWSETTHLQFRAEFFNLFNRTRFGQPNGTVGNPNFGRITSTTGDPRLVQLGLRFSY